MIQYDKLKTDDIGKVVRLLLVMHQESPVYSQFEPDTAYIKNLCEHVISNDQFGVTIFDGDELVGLMLGSIGNIPFTLEKAAFECVLYTLPDYRGDGAGVRLIDKFEDWAEDKGVFNVITGVSVDINSAMVNQMYLKLGYDNFSTGFRKYLN